MYDDKVMRRESSGRVVKETMQTGKRIRVLHEKAGSLAKESVVEGSGKYWLR